MVSCQCFCLDCSEQLCTQIKFRSCQFQGSCFLPDFKSVDHRHRPLLITSRHRIKKVSVLSGWCFAFSTKLVLLSIMLCLILVQNVTCFPILIWQKWTKCRTKVVIHGDLVPNKVRYLNRSLPNQFPVY